VEFFVCAWRQGGQEGTAMVLPWDSKEIKKYANILIGQVQPDK